MLIKSNGETMNWEIAGLWLHQIHEVLESAKEAFPHECTTSIESKQKNDGGPYGSLNNATFYFIQVDAPQDTDPRFIEGIKDVLKAVAG